MPSKKGGGLIEGLWTGTALFAAMNSRTYTGFLYSFLMYALFLVVAAMLLGLLMKLVTGREFFTVEEIKCQPGETPTDNCYGEKGCTRPSGNCYKLLSTNAA